MNLEHTVVAFNDAESSDNRMHSDEMAQRFGFRGALVPGVTVYGYMTLPLIREFGESWLGASTSEVRLIKPAYHLERLDIRGAAGTESTDNVVVEAWDPHGVRIATVQSSVGPAEISGPWDLKPAQKNPDRAEICWENVELETPFAAMHFNPTRDDNLGLAEMLGDTLPLWGEGEQPPLHPFDIARMTNRAFTNVWHMPAWMHVGTVFRHHRVIRIGDPIEMRTMVADKWERKGHQFARLYIAMLVDGQPAVEAEHTAIFKVADRQAA